MTGRSVRFLVALACALGGCDIGELPPTGAGDLAVAEAHDAAPCDGCANLVDLAGSDGALLPLFAICTRNAECQSGICHLYPDTGESICTRACAMDSDCPPPSPGCNKMGLCRIH